LNADAVFIEFMLGALAQALRAGIDAAPSIVSGIMSGKTPLAIIQALQKSPELTIPTLAAQLSVSSRTIERHLQKLQQHGVLKRIGSAKGGHWQSPGQGKPAARSITKIRC